MSEENSIVLLSLVAACQNLNSARCCSQLAKCSNFDSQIEAYIKSARDRLVSIFFRTARKLPENDLKQVAMVVGRLKEMPSSKAKAFEIIEAACIYDLDGADVEIIFKNIPEEKIQKRVAPKKKSKKSKPPTRLNPGDYLHPSQNSVRNFNVEFPDVDVNDPGEIHQKCVAPKKKPKKYDSQEELKEMAESLFGEGTWESLPEFFGGKSSETSKNRKKTND